ncbi:MAG: LysE family transporter [Rhizomicrobium sp.]|jgi:threonine/homoserine/homoserine lactone efflux protein
MNYIVLIVSGVLIGFFAALPIGPVNLICIRRTLQCGSFHGFVSGLGAALGDGLFASITGFGFTAVAQLIVGFSTALQLIGGLLLLSFGIRTFYTPPPLRFDERLAANENGTSSYVRAMASTFVLTITNPATLFGFTALFAGLGGLAGDNPSFFSASFVVLGVFGGSTLWWLTLTTVVGLLHARINDGVVRLINEISGTMVALFGVVVLGHLVLHLLGR